MESPNNTIQWGQGAAYNEIGWGQGFINNINWGQIHPNSWGHPETNLTGQSGEAYMYFYSLRVQAAGGVIQNATCAEARIDALL